MDPRSDRVLFVFYDFETTQKTRCTGISFKNVSNLVCFQEFCAVCGDEPEVEMDCWRCRKRKHCFWMEPVEDLISYTLKS